MNSKLKKIRNPSKIIILFIIFSLNIFVLAETTNKYSISLSNNALNTIESEEQTNPRSSALISRSFTSETWFNNTDFSSGSNYWLNSFEGDSTDLIPSADNGVASYIVSGEEHEKQVILNTETQSEWTPFNKSENTLVPNLYYDVDDDGCFCGHYWNEQGGGQPENTPEIYWRNNVSMGRDMSDYNITSVSFNAIINGTVSGNVDTPGDTQARYPTSGYYIGSQYRKWDHAIFYIELSDTEINTINTYEIAYNRTVYLGNEARNNYTMEMYIDVKSDQAIINALENVLTVDPGHDNFTVVLGIYIYCEDNYPGEDQDRWDYLRFKSLNLTFTYEKIIDKGNSLSWYQIGNMINHSGEAYHTNTRIDDVSLNFEYSLNRSWPSIADECRFEIHVNNKSTYPTYSDIKLISYDAGGSFIEARSGGYELSKLVQPREYISLSIRIYIANEFSFNEKINISIDNIYFRIAYTVFYNLPDLPPEGDDDDTKTETSIIEEPWFNLLIAIAAIAGATCLTGYIVYYIRVLKYPKPVRKVRKYRRTLKKKKSPDIPILGRNIAFDELYKGKLETIGSEVKRKSLKPITIGEKSVEKLPKKITPDKVDKLIGKTKK